MALEDLVINKPKKLAKKYEPWNGRQGIKVADWLKDKTIDEVAELWKIGHSAKKLTEAEKKKFAEIKHCLRYKFDLKRI